MRRVRSLLCTGVVAALLLPASVFAIGLSVTPSHLDLASRTGEKTTATLTVENASDDVAFFEAYPDEFAESIEVSPRSFTLEAHESRELVVIIDDTKRGRIQTNLSIVARPISDSVYRAAGGIKVPISYAATDDRSALTALAINSMAHLPVPGALTLLVLMVGLLYFTQKKTWKSN